MMKSNKRQGWVGLEGLRIKGAIGVYHDEKKNGSHLEVSISVYGNLAPAINTDEIENSFNYEQLAAIARNEIEKGNHLLEPVADGILESVLEQMPDVRKVEVELRKLDPPLGDPCDASVVMMKRKRKKEKKRQQ